MFLDLVVKGVTAAAWEAIVSEVGARVLGWLEGHCQTINAAMKTLSKAINGLDLSFTAEQAANSAFAANLNVMIATGIAVISFSIVVGGVALGIKAYWKGRGFKKNDADEVERLENEALGPGQTPCEVAELQFQERPSPILHQAQPDRLRQHFEELPCAAPEFDAFLAAKAECLTPGPSKP